MKEKEEIFYNRKEDNVMKLINKGNFIYYNRETDKYIDSKDILRLEECYKIYVNKELGKLIKVIYER